MKLIKKFKKGFSLLEIILVLAIAAALVIAALLIYPKVKSHNNILNEVKNIGLIVAAAKELYGGKANYQGLTTVVLAQSGLLPESLLQDGVKIRNSWNGSITYTAGNGSAGNYTTVQVQSSDIPKDDCFNLVSQLYGAYKGSLDNFQVNYTNIYMRPTNTRDEIPFDMNEVQKACTSSATSTIYINFL